MVLEEPIGHIPVLTSAVRDLVAAAPGETVVDATLGLGGHARLFADAIGEGGTLIGLDADERCLAMARPRLESAACRVELVHANFCDVGEVLESLGLDRVDVLFADLGLNSVQLDEAERGFSFQSDGPLDMRMSSDQRETAADLVNRLKERELADLFYNNAQEFGSRRIARQICDARRDGRITTTGRLADIIAKAVGVDPASRKSKIHPATKAFLALRIAVNSEYQRLDSLLAAAPNLLRMGGRIGVIAFHSGEDKPVKVDFRERKKEGLYRIVTKKPVVADAEERRSNPRARSAKLRVAIRIEEDDI